MAQDIKPVGVEFYPEVNQALLKVQTKTDKPPSQQAISQIAAKFQQPTQPMQQPVFPQFGGQQPAAISDPYAPLLQEFDARRQAAIEEEKRGIAGYEDLLQTHLDKTGQGQKVDLSPLMALSDSWFGGNLAGNYKRPTDSKSALETTAALQQGLQKARGSLTDNEMQNLALRANILQKSDESKANQAIAKARLEESKNSRGGHEGFRVGKEEVRNRENFDKTIGQPMQMKGQFIEALSDVKNVLRSNGNKVPAVNSPEYTKYKSAVDRMLVRYNSDIAKLGALAGADLTLLSGATATSPEMMKTWFNEKLQGGVEGTLQVLDALEKGVDAGVEEDSARAIDTWGDTVAKPLENRKNEYVMRKSGSYKSSATPSQGMTREQKIEELRKRQGG